MPTINNLSDIHAHWSSAKVAAELDRSIGRGLEAAAIFLKNRVQELLSVPAPRVRVKGRNGTSYYRATTRATKGAPPRKLSGRLRAAQTYEGRVVGQEVVERVGSNVIYHRRLEVDMDHKALTVALRRWQGELAQIIQRIV